MTSTESRILSADAAIAAAVMSAASTWTYVPYDPEGALEQALIPELLRHFGYVDAPSRAVFDVPGWRPCPRGIDLRIRHPDGRLRIPIELKVEATDQTLWDAYKLTGLQQLPGVECGYLICAARETTWACGRNCVELFPAGGEPITLDSLTLFERNRPAWKALLRGGTARPIAIPATIEVTPIASFPANLVPGYEIRAVRITPGEGTIAFEDDWPLGLAV